MRALPGKLEAAALVCGVVAGAALLGGVWADSAAKATARTAHSSPKPHARERITGGTNGLQSFTITAGGRVRTFLLYVPPNNGPTDRLPLVLAYHAASGTAQGLASSDFLTADEQRQNMIIAFLQGYGDTWNDDAGDPPAEAAHVNDIAFTTAVLHQIESNYYVDMKHVVATGISNGAIFTELLGCREAAYLTLIVPVEGQVATTFSSTCRPAKPISVYEIHATADPDIPYKGGMFYGYGGPVYVLSAPASARRWAQLDGCALKGTSRSSTVSGGSVLTRYRRCADGVGITLESIRGGAHDWPPGFVTTLINLIKSVPGKRTAARA
jgi:polyhydroxybutyrate depolymerase